MNRWHAESQPQHTLPAAGMLAFGTTRRYSVDEQISKPAPGEAP